MRVGYNFVDAQGEFVFPNHKDYGVLLVVENTERPDYFRLVAAKLGFDHQVIEEESW